MTHTQHHPLRAHPPTERVRALRRASLTAGISLLALTGAAVFANFVALSGLVTPADPSRTAATILASEGLFRWGVLSWTLVVVLDVVIAWALLEVFAPVDRGLSQLAAWFRLAYAAVLMVGVGHLAGVPGLLLGEAGTSVFSQEQLQAQALLNIATFNDIYDAALMLFGAHLVVLGYLAYRSRYVPRVLGVLIVIAGLGYIFDGFAEFLTPGAALSIGGFTFIGEFLLALWLLVKGRHLTADALDATNGSDA